MKSKKSSQPSDLPPLDKEMLDAFIENGYANGFATAPDAKNRRSLAQLLNRIFATISKSSHGLRPAPTLQAKLRAYGIQQNSSLNRFGGIRGFLNFRIPVYQAGLALALLIMVFGAFSRSNNVSSDASQVSGAQRVHLSLLDSLRTIEQLRFAEEEKGGRNIKEDSLLIRFIVTTVDVF